MDLPDAQCLVCTRPFSLEPSMTDSLESLAICRDCKSMVSNPNTTQERDHSVPTRYLHPNSHRRSGFRRYNAQHSRGGSVDNSDPESFAVAFSQLINSARQSQSSTPNQSNRWSVVLSDTESDAQDVMDTSNYGESESNVSFGAYGGGDSDASFDDRHSTADRENILLANDLGIDPMQVGLSVPDWDSYTEDEDASEWEEVSEWDETTPGPTVETPPPPPPPPRLRQYYLASPNTEERLSQRVNPQWIQGHWRMGPPEIDISQPFDDFTGRLEDVLEPLTDDTDDVRRGVTPASTTYREKLPHVIVTQEHIRDKDGLICAVCKEYMQVKCRALILPCKHMYHPGCILPWLRTRNTCPVCRYELPMENQVYDTNGEEIEIEDDGYEYEYEDEMSVVETDNEVINRADGLDYQAIRRSDGGDGGMRNKWLFMAAAPIVSLVGIVLVFCFKNSPVGNANRGESAREDVNRVQRVSDGGRKKWWSIF